MDKIWNQTEYWEQMKSTLEDIVPTSERQMGPWELQWEIEILSVSHNFIIQVPE